MLGCPMNARRVDAHGSAANCEDPASVAEADVDDRRLALRHATVRRFGTLPDTIATAAELRGHIRWRTPR